MDDERVGESRVECWNRKVEVRKAAKRVGKFDGWVWEGEVWEGKVRRGEVRRGEATRQRNRKAK